jgi:hypothetical protein
LSPPDLHGTSWARLASLDVHSVLERVYELIGRLRLPRLTCGAGKRRKADVAAAGARSYEPVERIVLATREKVVGDDTIAILEQQGSIRRSGATIRPVNGGEQSAEPFLVRPVYRLAARPEVKASTSDPEERSELFPGEATQSTQIHNRGTCPRRFLRFRWQQPRARLRQGRQQEFRARSRQEPDGGSLHLNRPIERPE